MWMLSASSACKWVRVRRLMGYSNLDSQNSSFVFFRIALIMLKSIWIVTITLPALLAQDGAISSERIREHDRFLSLDLLEGRGVGQRGGDIATEYMATQFALAGARPAGDNGTYFQQVPLVGVET